MKKANKRFWSSLVTVWLAMCMMVAVVHAALSGSSSGSFYKVNDEDYFTYNYTWQLLNDSNGNATDSGDDQGTGSVKTGSDSTVLVVSARATKNQNGCAGSNNRITVTVTNNIGKTVNVSYTRPDGYPQNGTSTVTAKGKVRGAGEVFTLEANETFTIELYVKRSNSSNNVTGTDTLDFNAEIPQTAVTFYPSEYCEYTAGNIKIAKNAASAQTVYFDQGTSVPLSVTVPEGKYFHGWRVSSVGELMTSVSASFTTKVDTAVYPVILDAAPSGSTPYTVGNKVFAFWEDAVGYAQAATEKVVIINQTYTLPNTLEANAVSTKGGAYVTGSATEINYIIPDGVTVLIPRNGSDTTGEATYDGAEVENLPANMFRKLTLPSNCKITVNGILNINGRQGFFLAIMQGGLSGDYGCLEMKSGSSINVNGVLRVRGLIIGNEKNADWANNAAPITVNSGATVYQALQVSDFPGGTNASNYVNSGTSVVNQLYVQNIQVGTKYTSGAKLIGQYYIYARAGVYGDSTILGTDNDCLIKLSSGAAYFSYDPEQCVSIVDLKGIGALQYLILQAQNFSAFTMDTSKSVLPLSGAFRFNLRSGSSLDLNYKTKLLPGCVLTIDEGATLNVNNELYLYDTADYIQGYSGYSFGYYRLRANNNSLTGSTVKRNSSNGPEANAMSMIPVTTIDGGLVVNGTVNVNTNGKLYTSSGAGGNGNYPLSTTASTGRIVINAASNATINLQELLMSASGNDVKKNIAFTAAQGLYASTNTLGDIAGTTGTYKSTGSAWYNWVVTVKGIRGNTIATHYVMNGEKIPDTTGYDAYYSDQAYKNKMESTYTVSNDIIVYVNDATAVWIDDTNSYYATLAEAVSAYGGTGHIQMLTTSTAATTIDEAVLIDLNGNSVSGVTVTTAGAQFMDSTTDAYGVAAGQLAVTSGEENIEFVSRYEPSGMSPRHYVKVACEDAEGNAYYTFQRVGIGVTGMQYVIDGDNKYLVFQAKFRGPTDETIKKTTDPDDIGFKFNGEASWYNQAEGVTIVDFENGSEAFYGVKIPAEAEELTIQALLGYGNYATATKSYSDMAISKLIDDILDILQNAT